MKFFFLCTLQAFSICFVIALGSILSALTSLSSSSDNSSPTGTVECFFHPWLLTTTSFPRVVCLLLVISPTLVETPACVADYISDALGSNPRFRACSSDKLFELFKSTCKPENVSTLWLGIADYDIN